VIFARKWDKLPPTYVERGEPWIFSAARAPAMLGKARENYIALTDSSFSCLSYL
jgi:hypothetical protein